MNKSFFNYFYFTRAERNGTFLLCCLIGLSIISPVIHQQWFAETSPPTFINTPAIAKSPTPSPQTVFSNNKKSNFSNNTLLFDFDPNTASKNEFQQLGLSPKVSQTILNFRAKGGKFYQATDFKKIYGISDATFYQLEPYIKIAKAKEQKKNLFARKELTPLTNDNEISERPLQLTTFDPNEVKQEQLIEMGLPIEIVRRWLNYRNKGGYFYQKQDVAKIYGLEPTLYTELAPFIVIRSKSPQSIDRKPKPVQPIDINHATSADWEQLPGIGPTFASRIIKFREALGGFHSVEQVAETYGLADSTFTNIQPFLKPSKIQTTININTATLHELKSHPYLNYKQARAILNYREQHGNYASVEAINKIPALKSEIVRKITPYLVID